MNTASPPGFRVLRTEPERIIETSLRPDELARAQLSQAELQQALGRVPAAQRVSQQFRFGGFGFRKGSAPIETFLGRGMIAFRWQARV